MSRSPEVLPADSPSEGAGTTRHRGVLLVNIGTPDGTDVAAVRRYLVEFLSDPLVIQLPRQLQWMQRPLAKLIAWRRGPRSAKKYRAIWTDRGSPLRALMEDQAAALTERLPDEWSVYIGMRYGRPSIAEALEAIAAAGVEELVVVPLYPQFSRTTTGTTVDEVYRVLKQAALHVSITARTAWHDDAGYLNAQARRIADFAAHHDLNPQNAFLLYSAHGLPTAYVRRGDPYERQLTQSVRLINERLGWPSARQELVYQSRMGPTEWLQPDVVHTLPELAARGERRVLLAPVSFATDCLETLEELQIQAREQFAELGGELHVCPALNTDRHFIDALRQLVLRGPQPVVTWSRGHRPLLEHTAPQATDAPRNVRLDRLVMVGVSLENRIGSGRGPQLAYSAPEGLACAKKPHEQVEQFLSALQAQANISEAFVWNTCFRFECYAWLEQGGQDASQDCVVRTLREQLFAPGIAGVSINTLFGRNAWHHLMRTIAGLNSGLPGDKDIVEQFRTAFEAAERAGTAGPHSRTLVEEAIRLAQQVRQETAWGRLDPGYCIAALERVQQKLPLQFANLRHVVVGGSTTSRSILHALYENFDVKEPAVTLAYRAHQGGQMKLLRKAVGHGRRLRVANYSEPAVHAAIQDADVVYFGIDRAEPVLSPDTLPADRDLNTRPLYVLDFNTAGSTRDLNGIPGVHVWSAAQLDHEVEAYADALCADESFVRIVQAAEAWIEQQTPAPVPPSLELPCEVRDEHGHPSCGRCGRALAALEESRK